jgi:hypothetical protein
MSPVRARDLQDAKTRLSSLYARWQQAGGITITDEQLEISQRHIDAVRDGLATNARARQRLELSKIGYLRVAAMVRGAAVRWNLQWHTAAIIGAATFGGLAMPLTLSFTRHLLFIFLSGLCVFLASFQLLALLFVVPSDAVLNLSLPNLQNARAKRIQLRKDLQQQLDKALLNHRKLQQLWELTTEYNQKYRDYQELERAFSSRKNQILLRDWRSLRGVPFEEFLVEVFEILGYSVQTTKASGDQGVDLVVEKAGRRIAIQAKGYAKSVSTRAVHEVYTGMVLYGCRICAVITNSSFTRGAHQAAKGTGCHLIDGAEIPQLIQGRLF